MPQLPDHPDLAQLRRQARELLRAAAGGDADAIRRVRQVSEKTTLSTAQLALARASVSMSITPTPRANGPTAVSPASAAWTRGSMKPRPAVGLL